MTAFYASETGKKLLASGPIVAREVVKAAEIWQRGISRDLATEAGAQIAKVVNEQVAAQKAAGGNAAPAPEGAAAPAPEQAAPAPEGEAPLLQGLDAPVQ